MATGIPNVPNGVRGAVKPVVIGPAMKDDDKPREGRKDRIKFDLLTRPQDATLDEINRAVGHEAWSYINDTKRLAKRCGGAPHWTGGGGSRRFWITIP
jgi:hypothetical protein